MWQREDPECSGRDAKKKQSKFISFCHPQTINNPLTKKLINVVNTMS